MRFFQIQKKVKVQNPISVIGVSTFKWEASMPLWGKGWSSRHYNENSTPHLWSMSNNSSILIEAEKNSKYFLLISILRFVSNDLQELIFSLNGRIISPYLINIPENSHLNFLIQLETTDTNQIELIFNINKLISFSDIDPSSDIKLMFGVALEQITIYKSTNNFL